MSDLQLSVDVDIGPVGPKLGSVNRSIDGVGRHVTQLTKLGGNLFTPLGKSTTGVLGGIGGLGKGILGLVKPFGLVTIGAGFLSGALSKTFVDAANEAEQAGAQLNAVLKSTKGVANVSMDAASKLADRLSSKNGLSRATDEAIMSGEAMMLTFTNVRNGVGKTSQIFDRAIETTLDMATAMNSGAAPSAEQLSKQSIQLGKALNDPIKGIGALSKVGVTFDDQQRKSIKTFMAHNDIMSAQKVILDELAKEFSGSALASAQTFAGEMQTLHERVGDVQERMGKALMPALQGVVGWLSSPEVGAGIEKFASGLEAGIGRATAFLTSPNFTGGLAKASDLIGNTLAGGFGLFGTAVRAAWPYIEGAFQYLTSPAVSSTIQGVGKSIGEGLGQAWGTVKGAAKGAWDSVLLPAFKYLTSPEVTSTIGRVAGAIGDLASKGFDTLKSAGKWAFDNVIKPVFDYFSRLDVQKKIGAVGSALGDFVSKGWNVLMSVGSAVWQNAIKPFFDYLVREDVQSFIGSAGSALGDFANKGWKVLSDIGTGIWTGALKPFFEWISSHDVSATIGGIAKGLGDIAGTGLKVIAPLLPFVVVWFGAWKLAEFATSAISAGKALLTWLVPGMAAANAQAAAGGPAAAAGGVGGWFKNLMPYLAIGGGVALVGADTMSRALADQNKGVIGSWEKAQADLQTYLTSNPFQITPTVEFIDAKFGMSTGMESKLTELLKNPKELTKSELIAQWKMAIDLDPAVVKGLSTSDPYWKNEWALRSDQLLQAGIAAFGQKFAGTPIAVEARPKLTLPKDSKVSLGNAAKLLMMGVMVDGLTVAPLVTVSPTMTMTAAEKALAWAKAQQSILEWNTGKVYDLDVLLKLAPKFDDGGGSKGPGLSAPEIGGGLAGAIRSHVLSQVSGMAPIEVPTPIAVQPIFDPLKLLGVTNYAAGTPDTSAALNAARAAQSAISAIADNIKSAMGGLVSQVSLGAARGVLAAAQGATSIRATLTNILSPGNLSAIGRVAMAGLAVGIAVGGPAARASASNVTVQVRGTVAAGMSPGNFVSSGYNVGRGLAIGIQQSATLAVGAARYAAQQAKNAVNAEFGIKSPSTWGILTGQLTNEGLAIGLSQNQGVLAAAESSMNAVIALAKRVTGKGTKDLMDSFSSITSAVSGAFDLASKIGGAKDFVAPGKGLLSSIFKSIDDIVLGADAELTKRKPMLTEARGKLAGFMNEIVGGLSSSVDLILKLGAKDLTLPAASTIKAFFGGVGAVVSYMGNEIKAHGSLLTEANAQMSQNLGGMVEGAGKALGLLTGLKDFVKPTDSAIRSFVDSVIYTVSYLGKFIQGWTEENIKQAGAWNTGVSALLDGAKKGLDLLSGLKEFVKPLDTNIRSFADSLFYAISLLGQRIAGWVEENVKNAGMFNTGATALLDGASKGVGLLGQLRDFVKPADGAATAFADGLMYLVSTLGQRIGVWTSENVALATQFNTGAGALIDGASKGAGLLSTLRTFVKPLDEAVISFADGLMFTVNTLGARLSGWVAENTVLAGQFGDGAGKLIDGAAKGLALLGTLREFVKPLDANITAFIDSYQFLINTLAGRITGWVTENTTLAGAFGDAMGRLVDGAGKGLDLLNKLREFVKPADGAITAFVDSLQFALNTMGARIGEWKSESLTLAATFGESTAKFIDGMAKGADLLTKLASKDFAMPATEAITAFVGRLIFTVDTFRDQVLNVWVPKAQEVVSALATEAGKLVDGIARALDPFGKLSAKGFTLPTEESINAFIGRMIFMVESFRDRVVNVWVPKSLEVAATLAASAGQIASGLGSALDPLTKLASFVAPTNERFTAFFGGLDTFLSEFKKRSAEWAKKAFEDTIQIAKDVGSVVTSLGAAIDPLVKLLTFGLPQTKLVDKVEVPIVTDLTGGIDRLFAGLDYFLEEFSKKAYAWSTKATEKTAQVAGWIGDIASNIGKVLDPIIKMGEASKITEQQIEGAMYGVWFALDQFNNVMSGGTSGTPFQGEWVGRATAFAKGVGEIFTELGKALSAIGGASGGGGGISSAFFDGLRTAWMSVFGPAQQEGTLLYAVLDRKVGMIAKLNEGVFAGLEFMRITIWGGRLDALKVDVLQKLLDLKEPLMGGGFGLGESLATGIASGITAGAGAIATAATEAVNKAIEAAKQAAGIKSPSTVAAREIGLPISQGVAKGILSGMGLVSGAMSGFGSMAYAGASGGSSYAPSTVAVQNRQNIVVYVDGVQMPARVVSHEIGFRRRNGGG